MTGKELKIRILLNTLDKYHYCLDSEIEEAEEQIIGMLREAYDAGMNNIGCDGCRIDRPDYDFKQWLEEEI